MPLLGRQPVGALVSVLLLLACAPAAAPSARPAVAASPAIPASLSSTPLASVAQPGGARPPAPGGVGGGVSGSSSDAALSLAAERVYFQQQGLAVPLEP